MARSVELEKKDAAKKGEMKDLDAEMAARRQEKSIAAQQAISALLKKKEAFMQETKTLAGAVSLVRKAIAKLQRAADLGLDDWSNVHIEMVKLSGFARKKIETQPEVLADLIKKCDGASVVVKDDSLEFAGRKDSLKKLKTAVEELEANYETWVECSDEVTLNLFIRRGEMDSLAKRHKVNIQMDSNWFGISAPPAVADKVAGILEDMFTGHEDIEFPANLLRAVRGKAKEVEEKTGVLIDVPGPKAGQGGWMAIRGLADCVQTASAQLNEWLDEQEGAIRETVNFADVSGGWTAAVWNQFRGDIQQMAQKFRIAVKETSNVGELELRGSSDGVSGARKELQMMLDWYRSEEEKAEKARNAIDEPPEEEDSESDGWSTAPVAEPTVAAW